MKRCPRCDRTYPDSEQFCEADGTALVQREPAFATGTSELSDPPRECKVCGGKAEPGEIICNFCGARLADDATAEPTAPARPSVSPERGAPSPGASRSMSFTSKMPEELEEPESGGRVWSVIGYLAAAAIALAAGIALALHLSARQAGLIGPASSPAAAASAAPAPSGPIVQLANGTPIAVTGESASAAERGQDVARKAFEDGRRVLADSYNTALGASIDLKDAMLVRLRVMPDGSVASASVRTSTDLHPSFDVEVIKDVAGWRFPAFGGSPVEIDYPMVFAPDASEVAALESALSAKVAALSPTEEPEYASATAAAPGPSAAAAVNTAAPAPSVAAVPPPPAEAPIETPRPVVRKRLPRRELAAIPKPTPALLDRVQGALRGNRKLGRVKAYTDRGTVTLFGKVYDDNDKALAERVVRDVPGVTGVNDTMTTDVAEWAGMAARITAQLQSSGLDKVTVKVIGRDAYLDGEVKTKLERERAVTIVEGAAPVTVRANLIRIATGNILGF